MRSCSLDPNLVLISILSNTVARIDAVSPLIFEFLLSLLMFSRTQRRRFVIAFCRITNNLLEHLKYLFQYAITTIEGYEYLLYFIFFPVDGLHRVNSDALFSYQPPFNILAFLILKPASWFLTPRALHSVNVFLIRVTSLPQLIIIAIYERHWAAGSSLRESSKDAAQSLFNSLPSHIKHMPLIEALVGSTSNDVFDAIFGVDVDEHDYDIFDDSDGEQNVPHLRSLHSRENMRGRETRSRSRSPVPHIRTRGPTNLGSSPTRCDPSSPRKSPRHRGLKSLPPVDGSLPELVASPASASARSPLAQLFGSRFSSELPATSSTPTVNTDASVRQIELLLEAVGQLPVQKLKEEMKELQVRSIFFCLSGENKT